MPGLSTLRSAGSSVSYYLAHPTFITVLVIIMVVFFISDIALIYYYAFVQ